MEFMFKHGKYTLLTQTILISMPDAMIKAMVELCKQKKCTRNELVKTALSKMLFDESNIDPASKSVQVTEKQNSEKNNTYEIPLDKVISVQYTLDDGKIIHVIRESKIQS